MAYRKSKGKLARSRKIQPSPLSIYLDIGTVSALQTSVDYIDLSQCASLINRRFYRQGLNWAVSGFKFVCTPAVTGNTTQARIAVGKLPATWVMSNAWEKSFRVWRQMIDNATEDSEMQSIKGRFLDFKIFADAGHHSAGSAANLLPLDSAGNPYAPGQWQMSDIAIPAIGGATVSDYEFVAVGPNDPGVSVPSGKNAKSVIQGYADSRALPSPEDPNTPDDASLNWMSALFREGNLQDNAVIGMLEATGDNPPYPFEGDVAGTADTMYPGGETNAPALELHDLDNVSITTIGGMTRVKGGLFPCGLIKIATQNIGDNPLVCQLIVDLVPGSHRGYLCEPMTEM